MTMPNNSNGREFIEGLAKVRLSDGEPGIVWLDLSGAQSSGKSALTAAIVATGIQPAPKK